MSLAGCLESGPEASCDLLQGLCLVKALRGRGATLPSGQAEKEEEQERGGEGDEGHLGTGAFPARGQERADDFGGFHGCCGLTYGGFTPVSLP